MVGILVRLCGDLWWGFWLEKWGDVVQPFGLSRLVLACRQLRAMALRAPEHARDVRPLPKPNRATHKADGRPPKQPPPTYPRTNLGAHAFSYFGLAANSKTQFEEIWLAACSGACLGWRRVLGW